jgi:hypothetical protein
MPPHSIKDPQQQKVMIEAILRSKRVVERKELDSTDQLEYKKVDIEARITEEKLNESRSYRSLRERYAKLSYRYLIAYSIACYALLIMSGFGLWSFKLDATVLAVVAGSSAASAIGLVHQVVKGLFGK